MDRVLKLGLIVLVLVTSVPIAQGGAARIYRVGLLSNTGPDLRAIRGVSDGLRDLGYIQGENLLLEISPKSTYEKLHALAIDFKEHKVDVIVTIGQRETAIAKQVTRDIPIVFAPAGDPLGAGFVNSFRRPGGNLTGVAYNVGPEKHTKELEIFRDALPGLKRVALVYDETSLTQGPILTAVRKTARYLKLDLSEFPVKSIADSKRVASSFFRKSVDGVFNVCSSLFGRDQETPAILTEKKIPLYGCPSQVLDHGALISYAPNGYSIGRRAASYVDRILKGARPQELPVESPTKFELTLNLKTADAIGIRIPPEVLQRADKVIR